MCKRLFRIVMNFFAIVWLIKLIQGFSYAGKEFSLRPASQPTQSTFESLIQRAETSLSFIPKLTNRCFAVQADSNLKGLKMTFPFSTFFSRLSLPIQRPCIRWGGSSFNLGSVSTRSTQLRNINSLRGGMATDNQISDNLGLLRTLFGQGKEAKKRVLILMSDTGGGHKASALALEAAFDILFPGKIEVDIVDIWTEYASYPYNRFVPGYQYLAKNPILWKALWEYGKFPPARLATEISVTLQCFNQFKQCLEDYDPDLVISVHPLCQELPLRCLKSLGNGERKIPFVTVVTDLGGAHPTWFSKEVDQCFVPSEALKRTALKCGLRPSQITMHGLPIRPGFWRSQSTKPSLRRKLGLKIAEKTVLVVGGGDGVGELFSVSDKLIQTLSKMNQKSQVVVVCGKNEEVKNALLEKTHPENVNVVVNGFVSNMDEWMGAADCIVTKAGPGTIAEAAIKGLPCMLSAYLPGQEEGNIPYVVNGGYGDYSSDPKKNCRHY